MCEVWTFFLHRWISTFIINQKTTVYLTRELHHEWLPLVLLTSEWLQPVTHPVLMFLLQHHTLGPLSLLLSPPIPKVTVLVAPCSHQLTPRSPPSSVLPTSFGSSLHFWASSTLSFPLSSPLSNPSLPSPWLQLAGPAALRCPVINESFHTQRLSWLLGRRQQLAPRNS